MHEKSILKNITTKKNPKVLEPAEKCLAALIPRNGLLDYNSHLEGTGLVSLVSTKPKGLSIVLLCVIPVFLLFYCYPIQMCIFYLKF